MSGETESVMRSGRRPLPQLPESPVPFSVAPEVPRYVEPPPPYTQSSLTSSALPSEKKGWQGCQIRQIWEGVIEWIKASFNSFFALFQRKKALTPKVEVDLPAALVVEPITEKPKTLPVDQEFPFFIAECPHLAYFVKKNKEEDLELLGFRFIDRSDGGEETFKEIDELDGANRAVALEEINHLERTPQSNGAHFNEMIDEIVQWARDHQFEGVMIHKFNKWDVRLVVEYMTGGFTFGHEAEDLRVFQQELETFKERLQGYFQKRQRKLALPFASQTTFIESQDLARFRHMLEYIDVDGETVPTKHLNQYWGVWQQFNFRPEHQIAIHLDQNEDVPRMLYHGMSAMYLIQRDRAREPLPDFS